MAAPDPHPSFVTWSSASITWQPDHYTLAIPAYFDARAERYITEFVKDKLPSHIEVTIQPGRFDKDERGASATEGFLVFATPRLFELDPRRLRELIDNTVTAAVRAGEDDEARDRARAAEFLRALRG